MGVPGLWKLLEKVEEPTGLETLEGQVVAVDAALWIYQASLGAGVSMRNPQLALFLKRICSFLAYKILPVFVFDGPRIPARKQRVLAEREARRANQDQTLSRKQKKILEKFAVEKTTEQAVEKVKDALVTPAIKAQRTQERIYGSVLPEERPVVEVVDLSEDEDEEVVVLKEEWKIEKDEGERLKEDREVLRERRLRPEEIPAEDSDDFSLFQLNRCLQRGRMNKKIVELSKPPPSSNILTHFEFQEQGLRIHRYERYDDPDIMVLEEPEPEERTLVEERGPAMTLDVFISSSTAHKTFHSSVNTDYRSPRKQERTETTVDAQVQSDFLLATRMAAEDLDLGVISSSSDSSRAPSPECLPGPSRVSSDEEDEHIERIPPPSTTQVLREDFAFADVKELLSLCGVPFVVAAGEAEAQCSFWNSAGAVDGVVSDDSDCVLFGAISIYRHIFSKKQHPRKYAAQSIIKTLGLRRSHLVLLGVVSGGDYSEGLLEIGVKKGSQLLKQCAADEAICSDEDEALAILTKLREILLNEGGEEDSTVTKLRQQILKNNRKEEVERILDAGVLYDYFHPAVLDDAPNSFHYEFVNLKRLEKFVEVKLGWDAERLEKMTGDVLRRWNQHLMQYGHDFTAKRESTVLVKEKEEAKEEPRKRTKRHLLNDSEEERRSKAKKRHP